MAKFYSYFPNINFDNTVLTDLLARIKVRDTWLNDPRIYYNYSYQDHDKPEHIAFKYYGDEHLHWIILLTNNIFDPNFEFPINSTVFDQYIESKYGNLGSAKSISINSSGSGYIDGVYQNVYPYVSYGGQGTGMNWTVTIEGGEVIKIDVVEGGTGYNENSLLQINNAYLGYPEEGFGFMGNISQFLTGYEYAMVTADPIYKYQKHVKITSTSGTQNEYYVVDKTTYYDLYQAGNPSGSKTILTNQGEYVTYEISRREPLVTIYDREMEVNESKRLIKLLKKDYVNQAKTEILRLLK